MVRHLFLTQPNFASIWLLILLIADMLSAKCCVKCWMECQFRASVQPDRWCFHTYTNCYVKCQLQIYTICWIHLFFPSSRIYRRGDTQISSSRYCLFKPSQLASYRYKVQCLYYLELPRPRSDVMQVDFNNCLSHLVDKVV